MYERNCLYHFSENPDIAEFEPRALIRERPPGFEWLNGPLVWAIDEWHSPMYLFPRDCPRILVWPKTGTTAADREWWMGELPNRMAAYIEAEWEERFRQGRLYRYTFDGRGFEDIGDAGMWVSRVAARPLDVSAVDSLPAALREANVELRIVPSFAPLRGAWDTTMHASGIRLGNSRTWK